MPQGTRVVSFRVSPDVLGPLGLEQLRDPALAILELVKNSWDADARNVRLSITTKGETASIICADDGHGMTEDLFVERWLVIGASAKRKNTVSPSGRPIIGEKGLGRLATYALGDRLVVFSKHNAAKAFSAEISWKALRDKASIEDYGFAINQRKAARIGTTVQISELRSEWTASHTAILVSHVEFLTSVPGESFKIRLFVNGKAVEVTPPAEVIDRLTEAEFEVHVNGRGEPKIVAALVGKTSLVDIAYRGMKEEELDSRLAGSRIRLKFFRRHATNKKLAGALGSNLSAGLLERYQGVRVFRDGINVPPYGISGDDWAGLEKQRTQTGGPTLVPGNSQLVGEVHVSRAKHRHFVITAGRSGFAEQESLDRLANYVRWAVRQIGTARRAAEMNIRKGEVPSRVSDQSSEEAKPGLDTDALRRAIQRVAQDRALSSNPKVQRLSSLVVDATDKLESNSQLLRLYAQLASTGIAATSFTHELRTEFDVVTDALDELRSAKKVDKSLIDDLNSSWGRIRAFAGLFQVVPVKLRRKPQTLPPSQVERSLRSILNIAPPEKVQITTEVQDKSIRLVPAELDSIMMNLISNSVKAISESSNRDAGQIKVKFTTHGSTLRIYVSDNGCGISNKVEPIMFLPLEGEFSEGTGMGLPIVAFIAEQYGGTVQHSRGEGRELTQFVVELRNVVPQ